MSTPSLLPDVEGHFKDLAENPDKRIDAELLDKLELQLTGAFPALLTLELSCSCQRNC
jgi:hypothetical protein